MYGGEVLPIRVPMLLIRQLVHFEVLRMKKAHLIGRFSSGFPLLFDALLVVPLLPR